MKKIIFLFLLSTAFGATAQRSGIKIQHEQVTVTESEVVVNFDVEIGRRAARGADILIYRPGLTDGTSRWALPEIVVQSRRGRIAERRREWVSGDQMLRGSGRMTENGDVFHYTARAPRQPWMNGARIEAEATTMGCCTQRTSAPVLLAMVPAFVPPAPLIEVLPPTTGERLAHEVSWVLPDTEFDRDTPSRMFERNRDGSLRVLFALDSWLLEPARFNNAEVLDKLVATLREIENSTDSRVTGIMVAGYASPEGSLKRNGLLGQNRADALKQYLLRHTSMSSGKIHIYNGVEDWVGLRMLVEASNMPGREAVLRVIDNTPIWDESSHQGRENVLMKLGGGVPYRFMLQNFFPLLRSAAYIKVFYENK